MRYHKAAPSDAIHVLRSMNRADFLLFKALGKGIRCDDMLPIISHGYSDTNLHPTVPQRAVSPQLDDVLAEGAGCHLSLMPGSTTSQTPAHPRSHQLSLAIDSSLNTPYEEPDNNFRADQGGKARANSRRERPSKRDSGIGLRSRFRAERPCARS